eukprot:GHVH01009428.1.p1 GENE.GHVH01009428.1~~GHVH01009428.1.p1  ORF type:complete len:167 (+),score=45.58 GHVH01009428.1:267-767(+)
MDPRPYIQQGSDLPVETVVEWEYEYVDVVEIVEVVETYDVPIIEKKIIEECFDVEVIREIPVDDIEWEEVEQVVVHYDYLEKEVRVEKIVEEELVRWVEVVKEVTKEVVHTVVEEVIVEEPIYVTVPSTQIKHVIKEVPVVRVVENEVLTEEEELIEIVKDVVVKK